MAFLDNNYLISNAAGLRIFQAVKDQGFTFAVS